MKGVLHLREVFGCERGLLRGKGPSFKRGPSFERGLGSERGPSFERSLDVKGVF